MVKEATARIKINRLLESSGWRFFDDGTGPANIRLESNTKIKESDLDALGENFEKTKKGFIDFLLLNERGFPFIVLEAKAGNKDPFDGKEQARKYAQSQKCRFVILSNGDEHYWWDLESGNPEAITAFPSPESMAGYGKAIANPQRLIEQTVGRDYVVLTQRPSYATEAGWRNESERARFTAANKLRFLRPYQERAIHALQAAVKAGKKRFLFEMATGTGKTLTAAALIKLFLQSQNAQRVLFLVDRIELEDQA
jgi:type I restriction enzyme R subunit